MCFFIWWRIKLQTVYNEIVKTILWVVILYNMMSCKMKTVAFISKMCPAHDSNSNDTLPAHLNQSYPYDKLTEIKSSAIIAIATHITMITLMRSSEFSICLSPAPREAIIRTIIRHGSCLWWMRCPLCSVIYWLSPETSPLTRISWKYISIKLQCIMNKIAT